MPWTLWDFKRWRRDLRYTQCEAAAKLGVSRGTIQHWESKRNPIPLAVELACAELARRWKQRPDFGPVTLVYADSPLVQDNEGPYLLVVHCQHHSTNASAVEHALRLVGSPECDNPLIVDDDGAIVWSSAELLNEHNSRREDSARHRASVAEKSRVFGLASVALGCVATGSQWERRK